MDLITKDNKIVPVDIKVEKENKKIDFEFQQIGIELEPIYGKRIWSIFYKYPLSKIKDAVKISKNKGIYDFGYLIGIIKKLK